MLPSPSLELVAGVQHQPAVSRVRGLDPGTAANECRRTPNVTGALLNLKGMEPVPVHHHDIDVVVL